MKLNFEVTIKAGLKDVWAAFDNAANMRRWQSWCNFRFRGIMKIRSLFLAKSIRNRTQADLERFKLPVETDLAGEN